MVEVRGSGRSPGEGNGYPLQYSCLEKSMDRGAWRVTVHGVANSLARLCTQHTVSFDIIVNLLCQMQHPYNHYLKPSRKALFKRNQPQSVEEEKTWSQGPGNKGPEAGFQGSWGGERRESRGRRLSVRLHNQHALHAI